MKIICSLPKPVGHCRNKRLIVVNIYPEKEKNTSQTSIIVLREEERGGESSLEKRGKSGRRGKEEGMRNTEQKEVRERSESTENTNKTENLKKRWTLFLIVYYVCVSVWACTYKCSCLWSPERVLDPWNWGAGGFKLPCGSWEPNMGPLQEKRVPSAAESSLHPSTHSFLRSW